MRIHCIAGLTRCTQLCRYAEILELFEYCKKIGINAELETIFDGGVIRFDGYGDIIQHEYSYGSKDGCVEPAIGCSLDYTAVTLEKAKELVREYKEKQSGRKSDG